MVDIDLDLDLEEAALSGDVSVLETKLADRKSINDYSCLLARSTRQREDSVGNILHLAAWNRQEVFFQRAIELIPESVVRQLLSHQESSGEYPGYNPLHVAAYVGHLGMVKHILGFCKSVKSTDYAIKPWLARDGKGQTPLHVTLKEKKEDCALEILSIDMELLCSVVDNSNNSPLFLAVKHGYDQVAKQILTSAHSCSVSGEGGFTALHFVPNCSEEVCRLLTGKHHQLIKQTDHTDKYTVLHQWVKLENQSRLEYIVNSDDISREVRRDLVGLVRMRDRRGDNPFHVAVKENKKEASKTLANVYEKDRAERATPGVESKVLPPWLAVNGSSKTPMDYALEYDHDREALNWLTTTFGDKRQNLTVELDPLFHAVKKGEVRVGQQIWDAQIRFGWSPICPGGKKIWQAALTYSEEVAKWVADRLPHSISEQEVVEALRDASENGYDWLVTPMLKKHPSALSTEPLAWSTACEKGHFSTLVAFIDNCPYFRDLCLKEGTTPLHLIKFKGYEQHRKFLEHPVVKGFRNYQESDGATPLHRAIRNENIHLTEVLLTMDDVNRSLKDKKENKTPMALLVEVCRQKPEWDEMCKRNGIMPGLRTTYFQDKTNLYEVRNTLSVVSALLATLTFTAGFTLPGGFNNDTGEALLADKAAFLAFIISDAFAMCCSMLMLVFLVWSMVCDHNNSLKLIDHSMSILLVALCSTLVAFMTGVYTVIRQKCLWVAIVIIVMCCIFIFSAIYIIKALFIDIFRAVICRKNGDLEQGETSVSQEGRGSWIGRKASICFGGSSSHQQKSD